MSEWQDWSETANCCSDNFEEQQALAEKMNMAPGSPRGNQRQRLREAQAICADCPHTGVGGECHQRWANLSTEFRRRNPLVWAGMSPRALEKTLKVGSQRFDLEVLEALERLGEATSNQIHENTSLDRGRVKGAVTRLRNRGCIIAADNPAEGDGKTWRLTANATHYKQELQGREIL